MRKRDIVIIVVVILMAVIAMMFIPYYSKKLTEKNIPENTISGTNENGKDEEEINNNEPEENKEKAIDFTLMSLAGDEISLSDFKGEKVFLHFWGPNCPPCISELEYINEIYKENPYIVILTIPAERNKSVVEKYVSENGYEFIVLVDLEIRVKEEYKASKMPTSILIDEKGYITDIHEGAMSKDELIEFMGL